MGQESTNYESSNEVALSIDERLEALAELLLEIILEQEESCIEE